MNLLFCDVVKFYIRDVIIVINRILINGFGRIGRAVFRLLWNMQDTEVLCSHIIEPYISTENIAYLLSHDTIYGHFDGEINIVSQNSIRVTKERKKWDITISHDIDYSSCIDKNNRPFLVVDSSGTFNSCERANCAINLGVEYVLITSWQDNADFILSYGYNENLFNPHIHRIISTGICDTCAILPTIRHFEQYANITSIHITTLHPWLGYQNLLDAQTSHYSNPADFRMGRSATKSVIPRETSLFNILKSLYSTLDDNVVVNSFRVPTDNVSAADIEIRFSDCSLDSIEKFFEAFDNDIIDISKDFLVSIDYSGTKKAGVIDATTAKLCKSSVNFTVWYDNEMGYSSQVIRAISEIIEHKTKNQ